jgi:DNA-binding transcriptional ArsR family regulator
MRRADLVQAFPRPSWEALVSLPANLTTGMLLVDYAAHGLATPTPWPRSVLPRLPGWALRDLRDVRVILAHGANLREFALERIPPERPEHEDWAAFRAWLEGLSQEDTRELVTRGIASGLAFYRRHMQPLPEVESWLEPFGDGDRDGPTLARLEEPAYREAAVRAVLDSWGTGEHGPTLDLVEHPDFLRAKLLRVLDELWERGFRESWETGARGLREAADSLPIRIGGLPVGGEEMIVRATGLEPGDEAAAEIRGATRIVFAPCMHLGRYLSVVDVAAVRYVLYEPGAELDRSERERRKARRVRDLEGLATGVVALGDGTRLSLLMLLAERGELFAQQIGEALGVHPSTVSRNLAELERVGLVVVRRQGGSKLYRLERERVHEICRYLLDTIG